MNNVVTSRSYASSSGGTVSPTACMVLCGRVACAYLGAGEVANGRLEAACKGVFQDGPLSPLLVNILPNDLDKELEQRNHRFACYADDFVILVKSKSAGERVMASVARFLKNKLKLTLNQDKSKVAVTDAITFLGFALKRSHIRRPNKAFVRFNQRVKDLAGRSWGVSMSSACLG